MREIALRVRLWPHTPYVLALAAIFTLAFLIRVLFPYDNVFTGDWVRFQINDPWYHMRVIENLAHHFPDRILFDPFGFFPGGQAVGTAPFFDYMVAFFAWIFGAGSPTTGLVEGVGAYFPPILGSLTIIPIFFIGKELFNKKAGLLAAALAAILPGNYLLRTLLGFTDHHCAEIFFSTIIMLFLILAVKRARQNEVSFESLRSRDWAMLKKPLIYALLAGITLGLYLLSWVGGAFFIFVIFLFTLLQYTLDHLRGRSTDYLAIVVAPLFAIAFLMIIPIFGRLAFADLQFKSLLIGILAIVAMSGLSRIMVRRRLRPAYFPLAFAVLAGVGIGLIYAADSSLVSAIWDKLDVLRPAGGMSTVAEAKGISASLVWENFSTTFYLSLVSLVAIVYLYRREWTTDKTLLLVWSLVMLVATWGQVRFAYYYSVNIALLTGYLSWKMLEFAGIARAYERIKGVELGRSLSLGREKESRKQAKKAKRKKQRAQKREASSLAARFLNPDVALSLVALIVIFFLAFYPNIGMAVDTAKGLRGATDDWHETLEWMKVNTPPPFESPAFFEERYTREGFTYPESAYGVMSWWDYGYWTTYIAERIPNANPAGSRGANRAADFLTQQDPARARGTLGWLGSRYVIIDYLMAMPTLKYHAFITWYNLEHDDYYESYYTRNPDGSLTPSILYYPGYYRSMCIRLYSFAGEAVVPENSTYVVTYEQVVDTQGNPLKLIKSIANEGEPFATYEAALAYLETEGTPNTVLVGTDPFASPVPLEKLEHFRLAHDSPSKLSTRAGPVSHVRVFEYIP